MRGRKLPGNFMFKNKITSNSRHRGYLVFNFFSELIFVVLFFELKAGAKDKKKKKKKKHINLAWVSKFFGSKTPRALFYEGYLITPPFNQKTGKGGGGGRGWEK